MLHKIQKRKDGFTIIEVMIVLAIAGLIMLIVFLAVPALQRNSRNTQRKNDVSTYAAAVNEWSTNNGGKMPVAADLVVANSGVNALANIGTLTKPTTVQTLAQAAWTNVDTMSLDTSAKCGAAGASINGPTRSFVILYAVESASGSAVAQCQEG